MPLYKRRPVKLIALPQRLPSEAPFTNAVDAVDAAEAVDAGLVNGDAAVNGAGDAPGASAAAADADPECYYIPYTNEIFLNYEDYARRVQFLTRRHFQCAHTGRLGLTYRRAFASEVHSRLEMERRIPFKEVRESVLRLANGKEGRMDRIVDDVYAVTAKRWWVGERVVVADTCGNAPAKWWSARVVGVLSFADVQKAIAGSMLSSTTLDGSATLADILSDMEQMRASGRSMPRSLTNRLMQPAQLRSFPPNVSFVETQHTVPQSLVYLCLIHDPIMPVKSADAQTYAGIVPPAEDAGASGVHEGRWKGVALIHPSEITRPRTSLSKTILKQFLKDTCFRDAFNHAPLRVRVEVARMHGLDFSREDEKAAAEKKRKKMEVANEKKAASKRKKEEVEGEMMVDAKSGKRHKLGSAVEDLVDHRQFPHEDLDLLLPPPAIRGDPSKVKRSGWTSSLALAPSVTLESTGRDEFDVTLDLWMFLISFGTQLNLFPFSLPEFRAALRHNADFQRSKLLAAVHVAMLKILAKDRTKLLAGVSTGMVVTYVVGENQSDASPAAEIDGNVDSNEADDTLQEVSPAASDSSVESDDDKTFVDRGARQVIAPLVGKELKQVLASVGSFRWHHIGSNREMTQNWPKYVLFCLNELSSIYRVMDEKDQDVTAEIIGHLAAHKSIEPAKVESRYLCMPWELRIAVLRWMTALALDCSMIKEYGEKCNGDLASYESELFDVVRKRKEIAQERADIATQFASGLAAYEAELKKLEQLRLKMSRAKTSRQISIAERVNTDEMMAKASAKEQERIREINRRKRRLDDEDKRLASLERGLEREVFRCLASKRVEPVGVDRWFRRWWRFDTIAGDNEACVVDETLLPEPICDIAMAETAVDDQSTMTDDANALEIVTVKTSTATTCRIYIEPSDPEVLGQLMARTGIQDWKYWSGVQGMNSGELKGSIDHWTFIDNLEQVDIALNWLDVRGERERELHKDLGVIRSDFVAAFKQRESIAQDTRKCATRQRQIKPASEAYLSYANKWAK